MPASKRPTKAQLNALRLIAPGGLSVHQFGIRSATRVIGEGGPSIAISTVDVLVGRGWVTQDQSVSLSTGQPLTITDHDRAFLD